MRIPGHDVEHNRKTRSHRSAGEVVTRIRSKTGAITQRSRVAPVTVSRVTYSSPIDCRAVSGWSSKPDRTWTRPRDNHLCSPVLAGRGKGHKCHRPRHHHNRSQPITTRRAWPALSLHRPTSHLCQFLNGFRFVAGVHCHWAPRPTEQGLLCLKTDTGAHTRVAHWLDSWRQDSVLSKGTTLYFVCCRPGRGRFSVVVS